MNLQKIKKLESLSRQIISQAILEQVENSESDFGLINICEVKISSDLSYADIYVSCFKNPELLTKALAKHNHVIQSMYHKAIGIRKLPKIRYRYDDKGQIGQDVCEFMNQTI